MTTLYNWQQASEVLARLGPWLKPRLMAGHQYVLTVSESKRSDEQNALMWACLTAFSNQLEWPVNGKMVKMHREDWKDVLSAAFKRETQRVAMGVDGGMVILGMRTSKMGKKQFSEFVEFIHSVAADRGVDLGDSNANRRADT